MFSFPIFVLLFLEFFCRATTERANHSVAAGASCARFSERVDPCFDSFEHLLFLGF